MRRILLLLALLWPATAFAAEVRVFAASSLADALREIGRTYERRTGERVVFNFGGSNMLARQIEQGAPADVFLSADEAKMDALARRKLIVPASRRSVLSNALAVVVPVSGGARITSLRDLASPRIATIAIGEPRTVPAGIYARELLTRHGLWRSVEKKVIPTGSVRGALGAVASGNVDAAIVFATDAHASPQVRIALRIPPAQGPPISYPFAAVAGADNPKGARRFLDYLRSREALTIFAREGFLIR